MLFLTPNQQHQTTEGKEFYIRKILKNWYLCQKASIKAAMPFLSRVVAKERMRLGYWLGLVLCDLFRTL